LYNIILSPQAERAYRKLHRDNQILFQRIHYAIISLKDNPLEGKSLKDKLSGKRSLRVGSYRIIYAVVKKKLIIYILDIGHRRDIYR